MESTQAAAPAHLGFIDKLRILLACGAAILLMYTVGWRVAEPVDPDLAVTLTQSGRGVWAIWPGLLVLTVVAASIGTAIAGRRLPEAGVFAASIGLAALALRSNSMQMVLGYCGSNEASGRRGLMVAMAWECLLWTAMLAVAWLVAARVRDWLWSENPPEVDADPARGGKTPGKTAPPPKATAGWPALAVTGVIAALVIWLTIARTPVAQIARGQVIASVAGGLFLGAMGARYFTSVADVRWYVLAVPAVALVGYLLGYVNAGMSWGRAGGYQPFAGLATTPPHNLARVLPIEYVAVGVSAALAGFWSGHKIQHAAAEA